MGGSLQARERAPCIEPVPRQRWGDATHGSGGLEPLPPGLLSLSPSLQPAGDCAHRFLHPELSESPAEDGKDMLGRLELEH